MCEIMPWHLYHNSSDMVRDVVMHLTFTQTFNPATYIATPIGVASWTIAIEMQAYLIFPLLARWAMKNPLGTLMTMAAGTFAFRGWCVWRLDEYNMVVNQLANFFMRSVATSAGKYVQQGEIIGYVGSTGNSTGNHLHLEVWKGGSKANAVNPRGYIPMK